MCRMIGFASSQHMKYWNSADWGFNYGLNHFTKKILAMKIEEINKITLSVFDPRSSWRLIAIISGKQNKTKYLLFNKNLNKCDIWK